MPEHPLRVAVITPYYREPLDVLRQCHESVRRQTCPCTHFMVADGNPCPEIAAWPVEHVVLSKAHGDCGNTPRGVGSLSAMNQGYDAIAYLDADNWFYPVHAEAMVRMHTESGAAVCTATRTIHRLDGSLMYVDERESDGEKHVDTNCLFLTHAAFGLLPLWAMMPREMAALGDRVMWQAIVAQGFPRAHCQTPTVAYRTQWEIHYTARGETPPQGSKANADHTERAAAWWESLPEDVRGRWQRYFGTRLL